MRILVVEDEMKVAAFLKQGLEMHQYQTERAANGAEALRLAQSGKFDLIILDINLPGISGFEVCRLIRQENKNIPIMMLSALGTTADKISGFNIGADDYLVKPFEFDELLVRIKALINRSGRVKPTDEMLRVADLEMDLAGKIVRRAGKKIELTAKEFLLLEYLMKNTGRVLSRVDIAENIWDITFDTGTNIIDLYIFYLRKKIDRDFSPKLIHTQVGMGYVLKAD